MKDEINIEAMVLPHSIKPEDNATFVMPECCTAGLDGVPADDCPHVSRPQRPAKRNIGL